MSWDLVLAVVRLIVAVLIAYAIVFVAALVNIVFERRVLGFLQDRLGPNRTGWQGILQSVADAFKMMGKEDFAPTAADKTMFTLAPIMVMIGAVAIQVVIPYTKGWTDQNLNVGLIYIVAITSFTVLSILLGGWASHNKYSLVGALRTAAQMVSYELPMILALLVVAMAAGSLSLNAVVAAQGSYRWFVFTMPFTFLLFFIASVAELNRGPFDLPESESELVAGYGTEYSGMRFGMFFLNEYAGMTIMSMVTVTLFLGGWQGPFANALVIHGVALVPLVWFLVKVYALVFVLVWIRLSVPRLQVDQLMGFAWKVLIPLGLVNILATAAVLLWAPHWKLAMAVYSWLALIAFVGLFDTLLRWRLKRQRRRVAVLT
jgi:NADH-quinone oxidoreductase subunit H